MTAGKVEKTKALADIKTITSLGGVSDPINNSLTDTLIIDLSSEDINRLLEYVGAARAPVSALLETDYTYYNVLDRNAEILSNTTAGNIEKGTRDI